jgi:hypothetical protein
MEWIRPYLFFNIMPAAVYDLSFPVGDRDVCAGIERRLLDEVAQPNRPLGVYQDADHFPRFIKKWDADLDGEILFSNDPQNYIRYVGFPFFTNALVPIPIGKVLP